jgi:hypothetical protein
MSENRHVQRRRFLKVGSIEFNGGGIDCTVRNMSQRGASLEVESPVGIPQRFVLSVTFDRLRRPCLIVWRKAKRIGVKFDS